MISSKKKSDFAKKHTLETIKIVEETIYKYSQEYNKQDLYKKLPKKILYQEFSDIIDYLEEYGKIMKDSKDGIIFWVWNPERIKQLKKQGLTLY